MGASIPDSSGSGNKKADVEINVVPFIDLMSCLTAFLLVTAVWSSHAQINVERGGGKKEKDKDKAEMAPSLLITESGVVLGVVGGPSTMVDKLDGHYDWDAVGEVLVAIRKDSDGDASTRVEIAGEDRVTYQHVVDAMDVAIASGFAGVSYLDPSSLSVQFRE